MKKIKNELIKEMEFYFGGDARRIGHARKVLCLAEKMLDKEACANKLVVTAAALLHDIGIHECERKYGSTAGELQEIEGPPIARRIMEKIGLEDDVMEEVCAIIGSHHSPGEIDTLNFKILYDADCLVNMGDECDIGVTH